MAKIPVTGDHVYRVTFTRVVDLQQEPLPSTPTTLLGRSTALVIGSSVAEVTAQFIGKDATRRLLSYVSVEDLGVLE